MQVTLIFLVCFVSMTWQQDVWLPIPIRHFPFHPRSYQLLHHGAFLPRYGPNYGPDYLEEVRTNSRKKEVKSVLITNHLFKR